MDDLISRRAAIDAVHKEFDECLVWDESGKYTADEVERVLADVPSAVVGTQMSLADCISRQAAIDALGEEPEVWTGKDEYAQGLNNQWHYDRNAIMALPSAQPEQIARDIATIIENEKDMRVMLKNAEHTETHSCDYQRTETHDWISVAEALPRDDEEVIVTCLDDSGDTPFSYTTVAWHYKGMWVCDNMRCLFVIAWMPLPEPYKEEE